MTVRTGGINEIGVGDFMRVDRGVKWGIKVSSISSMEFVQVLVQLPDGTWSADAMLDDGFDTRVQEYPQVIDWFTKHLLPRLNAWLAAKFQAGGAPVPLTRLEQADQLITTRLSITQNPDGTLTASLKS